MSTAQQTMIWGATKPLLKRCIRLSRRRRQNIVSFKLYVSFAKEPYERHYILSATKALLKRCIRWSRPRTQDAVGNDMDHMDRRSSHMGWLRLVGSLKLQVSFAEYRLFYRALLQKRPAILRSLLIVATP